MAVTPTQAAKVMEEKAETLSSHTVISLLLSGAMERVAQAKACVRDGNDEDKLVLITKLIGIVNGLRQCLNMEGGGEIAVNLDTLYSYMAERLQECQSKEEMLVLNEVGKLLTNVREGWDAIADISTEKDCA